jgi:PAS domain S-box-containing protein
MIAPVPVNILLVDDEPANLLTLETALAPLNANLVQANSGEAALGHVLSTDFTVILLELQMSKANGFEVAQSIRGHSRSQSTPIIFIVAPENNEFSVKETYALGAVDYLFKPVMPEVLHAKLALFIDLYRKNAELSRLERERHAAALNAKDERIRLILDNIKDYAFVITDCEGRVIEWEGGAESITGWRAEEAIGQPVSIIFTPEDKAAGRPETELHCAKETGRSENKRWHIRKDGARFFADGIMVPLYADGRLHGFAKLFRDATDRKRSEVLASGQKHALELAVAGAPLPEVLDMLAHTAEASLDNTKASILLLDADGQHLRHGAAPSLAEAYNRAIDGIAIGPTVGSCGTAAFTGKPIIVRDIQTDPLWADFRDLAGMHGLHSCWSVPILSSEGKVLGIFALYAPKIHAPTSTEQETVVLLANTATLVLDRHRETRERKDVEERLRLATEAAELGVWMWHLPEDRGTWENDRMYEIFGLPTSAPPLSSTTFLAEIIHPDDAKAFQQAAALTLETDARFYFEGRFYRPSDNDLRWLELTGLLRRSADGTSQWILGTAADITDRKRTIEALEDVRTRLTATLAAGEVATWTWDIRADRIHADPNLTKLFAVSEADVAGGPIASYLKAIHPEDIEPTSALIQEAIKTGKPYEATYRVRNIEGEYRSVIARGKAEYDNNGVAISLPGVVLDVTRQKKIEEAFQATQQRYRTLIESMDEGFCIIDIHFDTTGKAIDGRFIEINPSYQKHTGLSSVEGQLVSQAIPGIETYWFETYGKVVKTGESIRFEEESPVLGRWFDVSVSRLGDGDSTKVALIFTDITARKRSEEDLRRLAADLSEANRRKTEFLATLAHELRNPLAPMRTGLDLMRMTGKIPEGSGKVLEMMDRQLKQLVHLIDDLMDISRINSGKIVLKKERIELKSALTSAVEAALPAIEAAQHQLDVQVPDQSIMLEADPTRLAQILGNLLTNAAKYTPNGGRITLAAWQEKDVIMISVTDSGIGISEEELAGVFEMFSQVSRNIGRAQGGLGIGLSLVRSLVEMHGGTISVNSPGVGEGSTFTVRFPVSQDCGPNDIGVCQRSCRVTSSCSL